MVGAGELARRGGWKVLLWAGRLEYVVSVLGGPWESVHQTRPGMQGHPRSEYSGPVAEVEHDQVSSYPHK